MLVIASARANAAPVELSIDPAKTLLRVDEKIYGHFLEHIYRSCNGGRWGDMIWNRNFEETPGTGVWRIADGVAAQLEESPNVRLVFGNAAWTDYEFTLEARKTHGTTGFLIKQAPRSCAQPHRAGTLAPRQSSGSMTRKSWTSATMPGQSCAAKPASAVLST